MDKQIMPYDWSLNYSAEKKKQYSYRVENLYLIMIIMFFIFPGLAVFFLIFILIMIGNISRTDSSASGTGAVLEKYKIDMDGITCEDVRNQRSHKYMWNEFSSYCPYSVAKPLYGTFLKKYAGDDFILERVGGGQIRLKAGVSDMAMVNSMLSKKLKIKNTVNAQGYRSFRMDPLKVGQFGAGAAVSGKGNFAQPQKFSSGEEEKRFYEEKRYFEKKNARASEQSFRNKIIAIYLMLVVLSLVGYTIYIALRDASTARDVNGGSEVSSGTAGGSKLAGSEYIVRCNADPDCQYYFFFKTDDPGSVGVMPDLARVSDSRGCVWAVINRSYGSTWEDQYPAPKDCILSSSIKNRKGCDPNRKVCVVK